ncbi:MAG: hypothetical protein MUE85_19620 [Microscillaceae bacterium]|jgi:hypothetical protein|nr:hypothetical protein [Microscillaceae bacterium]
MKKISYYLAFSLLIIFSACGGGTSEKEGEKTTDENKKAGSVEEAVEEVGGKLTDALNKIKADRKKKGDTLAIPYKELQKYLPKELKGYTLAGEMKGQQMNMQGMSFSRAEASYQKGDDRLDVSLNDYNQAFGLLQMLTMAWSMGISEENDNGKSGVITLAGHKGWEEYSKSGKEAKVLLAINERFFIEARAENQSDTEFLKSVVQSIDLKELEKK